MRSIIIHRRGLERRTDRQLTRCYLLLMILMTLTSRGIDPPGVTVWGSPKFGEEGTLILLSQTVFSSLCASIHMILWYNAITSFSFQSDSVGYTELRHMLPKWKGIRFRSLRMKAFILF